MAVQLYLHFNGNANEALDFYQNIFKGEVFKMPYGEMPPDENFTLPDEMKNKIAHASITMSDSTMYLADIFPGMGPEFAVGNNVQAMFNTKDFDSAKAVYEALLDGGHAIMPFAETFWAKGYGLLVDRFGVNWHVNVEQECG